MASSSPVHPFRYLSLFLILLVGVYLLVFLTGDKQAKPKLGIDLQGGTRVTLTARTPDGSRPTREALDQAQQIISARVNGLGVSGSEVVVDGDNLVITVPGNDGNEARNLGQTARLYIRPVLDSMQIPPEGEQPPGATPQMPPGAIPGLAPGASPSPLPAEAPPQPAPPPEQTAPPAQPAPQPRPYPQEPPSPTPPSPTPAPASTPAPSPAPAPPPTPPDPRKDLADSIAFQKALRQNPQLSQIALSVLLQSRCQGPDPLAGNDDPNQILVTCSQDRTQIYLLDKSIISGDQIDTASAAFNQQPPQWVVNLKFKPDAANTWADYTAAHVGTQTAFVLDSQVVSAPVINEPIPGGNTQITGDFSAGKARDLANVLKYGSLPLSFESSEAETVSATLGLTSLKAGLIAGAIGFAIVLLYSLLVLPSAGPANRPVAGGVRCDGVRDPGSAGPLHQLHAGLGRHRRSDHRHRHHRRLLRRVLRAHQRRDTGRPFVPVGCAARLGAGPEDDRVRQRGDVPCRRGAVLPRDRSGERLRVHAGSDDDPRRGGGLPGHLAAGVPGFEVGADGQTVAQWPWSRSTDRSGTSCRGNDGTEVGHGCEDARQGRRRDHRGARV